MVALNKLRPSPGRSAIWDHYTSILKYEVIGTESLSHANNHTIEAFHYSAFVDSVASEVLQPLVADQNLYVYIGLKRLLALRQAFGADADRLVPVLVQDTTDENLAYAKSNIRLEPTLRERYENIKSISARFEELGSGWYVQHYHSTRIDQCVSVFLGVSIQTVKQIKRIGDFCADMQWRVDYFDKIEKKELYDSWDKKVRDSRGRKVTKGPWTRQNAYEEVLKFDTLSELLASQPEELEKCKSSIQQEEDDKLPSELLRLHTELALRKDYGLDTVHPDKLCDIIDSLKVYMDGSHIGGGKVTEGVHSDGRHIYIIPLANVI